MTIFKVVQVRRDKEIEWTVEQVPHRGAYDLQKFYASKAEADAEVERLMAVENLPISHSPLYDHPHVALSRISTLAAPRDS